MSDPASPGTPDQGGESAQGTAPSPVRDVEYKGAPLDAERGPGLGCFWLQVIVLVLFIVLTPLSVRWNWPPVVSGILLFVVIALLLLTGQTVIFLLRLVAADRRGRRRPLASATRTVGELEDEGSPAAAAGATGAAATGETAAPGADETEAPTRTDPATGAESASPPGEPESDAPSVRE